MPHPDTERNHAAQAIVAKALRDDGAEIDRLRADKAELLAALNHLLHRYLYDHPFTDFAVVQARAAIAKAEGRP